MTLLLQSVRVGPLLFEFRRHNRGAGAHDNFRLIITTICRLNVSSSS